MTKEITEILKKDISTQHQHIMRWVCGILSMYFLSVSLSIFPSVLSVEKLLQYTDIGYLSWSVYVLGIIIFLGNFYFVTLALVFVCWFINNRFFHKNSAVLGWLQEFFFSLSSLVFIPFKYSSDLLGGIVTSIDRLCVALLVTGLLTIIFLILNIWSCATVPIPGGTAVECPPSDQLLTLFLASFIYVWGFAPQKIMILKRGAFKK